MKPEPRVLGKSGAFARHILSRGIFNAITDTCSLDRIASTARTVTNPHRALGLLCRPLDSPGDVVEQLASRQELVTNRGIIELATRLYVDTENMRPNEEQAAKAVLRPPSFGYHRTVRSNEGFVCRFWRRTGDRDAQRIQQVFVVGR
jgi:hypothetical protein